MKLLFMMQQVFFALALGIGANTIQAQALDGRAFVGEAGEKGKAADEKDVIGFADGKFHSSACDRFGYGWGDYKAVASGDGIAFEAKTQSEADGRLVWRGMIG